MTDKNIPKQVAAFVAAIKENGSKVWSGLPDDKKFIDTLVFVSEDIGVWEISDNYEKFFSHIYIYVDGSPGAWKIRQMYSGEAMNEYSFEKAMADARIMYTG